MHLGLHREGPPDGLSAPDLSPEGRPGSRPPRRRGGRLLHSRAERHARRAPGGSAGSYGVAAVTDVAPLLVPGRNVVTVTAVNGIGAAAVLLRLDSGGRPLALSGPDWKVTGTPPPPAWATAPFDNSAWARASVLGPAFGGPWGGGVKDWPSEDAAVPYLSDILLRPVRVETLPGTGTITGGETLIGSGPVHLVIRPAPAGAADPASLVLDFGREVAGKIQVRGPDGAQVQVGTGESREECLKAPWGGPHLLTLKTGATQSTPNSAFRYVRLAFFGAAPFVLSDVVMDNVYYPVRYQGAFDCSDPLLTKIWYTGAYTAHLGMQQDIYDGPKRDRLLWSGDMQVSGEVINDVFADRFLMEKDLTSLRAGIQGGKPADELPTGEINSIPGYSAAWFCTLADFYRHSGDDAFLRSQHALILSLLRFQQTDFDAENLYTNPHRAWDFVDWSSGLSQWNPEGRFEDTPEAQTATDLFLIRGVREAVFLLRALRDTANADKYAAWADTLTAAARKHLADPKTRTYTARRQDNVMAVLSGIATPAQQAAIYDTVLKPGSPDWTKDMTPYYAGYLLTAYSRLGHTQDALDYARHFWGGMIAQGATTFWERYNPSWKPAGPDLDPLARRRRLRDEPVPCVVLGRDKLADGIRPGRTPDKRRISHRRDRARSWRPGLGGGRRADPAGGDPRAGRPDRARANLPRLPAARRGGRCPSAGQDALPAPCRELPRAVGVTPTGEGLLRLDRVCPHVPNTTAQGDTP